MTLHTMEDVWLLDTEGVRTGSTTTRIAVPGGWLYTGGQVAQFVADPTAEHARDTRITELENALAFEQLTAAHYAADLVTIVQLCGGDVDDGPSAARECVERVLSERGVAGARRLKLREGYDFDFDVEESLLRYKCGDDSVITEDRLARSFTAYHADGSETDHATRLEAHDSLIASGSESPFEAVTGPAVKS
jgi:hypothetical protein